MMTRFDSDKHRKTPEEWSMVALNHTQENHLQWNVIGGIVLAALAASTGSMLTGGLLAVYFFWDSWKKATEIQRNQAAIVDFGCIAQALEGDSFVDYVRQVGVEGVLAELQFAAERNLPMSNSAADFFEDCPLPVVPVEQPPTPPALKSAAVSQIDDFDPTKEGEIDIVGEMSEHVTNTLIIGVAGSGKGMLVSNALRAAKGKHPDLKVFVIDPKADPNECGYFDGVADVVKRFPCENQPDEIVVGWLEKCFDEYYEFVKKYGRTLLFLDEGSTAGGAAERIKSTLIQSKVSSISGLGDSTGKNIWIAARAPFVGGLGIKLSVSSEMTTIAIVCETNLGTFKQWSRSSILEKISLDKLTILVENSPAKRAVYFGKTGVWYSMPRLKNYSSFDRDTRNYLPGSQPPKGERLVEDYELIQKLEASLNDDKNIQDETSETENSDVSIILDWLQKNRVKQWVKFKGKEDRDMVFIKFLSLQNITSSQRDNAINLLTESGKLELSPDGCYLRTI
jgi:hypothetical protein